MGQTPKYSDLLAELIRTALEGDVSEEQISLMRRLDEQAFNVVMLAMMGRVKELKSLADKANGEDLSAPSSATLVYQEPDLSKGHKGKSGVKDGHPGRARERPE